MPAGSRYPLARLVAAALRARRQEGERAARLLHHELGQILSAAGLELDVARRDAEPASPEVADRLQKVQGYLEQAIEQVRALSYDLNPSTVARIGLTAALERLVARYQNRTEMPIRLHLESSTGLPAAAATGMYRIAECAVDNAVQHSGAPHIEILLYAAPVGWRVLEVRDDGTGFSPVETQQTAAGFGLPLMECYALDAGLELALDSQPGKGTIVKAVYRPGGAAS